MKIQALAIIFIIIILPITIIIGEYASTQIEIFKLEQAYDSRLITATHDALKAFQINTFNDAFSDIADSKISSIEASANAFYSALESSFGLEGYSKENLQMYVPALVYTMYDGYYIYSPYSNIADTSEGNGLQIKLENGEVDYGFKPYVYYSCRYVNGDIDVIINYSLDNYITVQGTIDEESVYESGYLLTVANSQNDKGVYYSSATKKYYYCGIEILEESNLTDYLLDKDSNGDVFPRQYKYIKLNGTKYYWDEDEEYIFSISGSKRGEQAAKSKNKQEYNEYVNQIEKNSSAINYYRHAYEFSNWVNDNLGELTLGDAVTEVQYSGNPNDKIFENIKLDNLNEENIEYPGSNFNLHRKEVIRHSIESNLSVAIANFNSYSSSTNDFQMPKLKENEWEMLENEISIISFLQGLNLGGKIYNGYTVVTNDKTEEVVKEERIYITVDENGDSKADYYHKINDKHFTKEFTEDDDILAGVLDLDFEVRKDGATGYSYTQKRQLACYTSIVGQENVDNTEDSIYEYLQSLDNSEAVVEKVKQIYYTALGRERWGTFKIENSSNILDILAQMEDEDFNGEPTPEPPTPVVPPTPEPPTPVVPPTEDNKAPEIIISDEPDGVTNKLYEIPSGETSVYIIKQISATDEGSGVANLRFKYTYSEEMPQYIDEEGNNALKNSTAQLNATPGTYYLHVKATDNAGNVSTKTVKYTVTKAEEATCSINIIDTDGRTEYKTNGATTTFPLTKTIKVEASKGVNTIQYAFSSSTGNSSNITSWKTVSGNGQTQVSATATGSVVAGDSSRPRIYLHVKVTDMDGNVTILTPVKSWSSGKNTSEQY